MKRMDKIDVLGTEYNIEVRARSTDSVLIENDWCGYCSVSEKLIVITDFVNDEKYTGLSEVGKERLRKETLRHEIVHAFLAESGLQSDSNCFNGAWSENEEMIDWFAIQMPKIFKVYSELEIL